MKPILLLASLCFTSAVFASAVVDLDDGEYLCKGQKITYETQESVIQMNCKNYKLRKQRTSTSNKNLDDENNVTNLSRVHFTTDDGSNLQCYYRNKTLYKCKIAEGKNLSLMK